MDSTLLKNPETHGEACTPALLGDNVKKIRVFQYIGKAHACAETHLLHLFSGGSVSFGEGKANIVYTRSVVGNLKDNPRVIQYQGYFPVAPVHHHVHFSFIGAYGYPLHDEGIMAERFQNISYLNGAFSGMLKISCLYFEFLKYVLLLRSSNPVKEAR
jgi:hypothetical protein